MKKKEIFTFLILVLLISAYPYYLIITKGGVEKNGSAVLLLMWAPGIAGIICKFLYRGTLQLKFGGKRGLLSNILAYFIPLLGCLIVYNIAWSAGIGEKIAPILNFSGVLGGILFFLGGVILSTLTALGEELGWRGYLTPLLLDKFSTLKTTLIVATIWSLFHYPLLILSDYNNGNILLSLIFFTISIFAVTLISTIFTKFSSSLWPAVIIHASHNYFVGEIFDKITKDLGSTREYTTEFGLGLAIYYTIFAFILYRIHVRSSRNILVKKSN